MKVFLTGITGLLGNNIARALTAQGDQVIALVRQVPSAEMLRGVDVETVTGDLQDTAAIDAAIARCDAVVHSAALLHIGWTRMEESMKVNRDGTQSVVDAAMRHGKRMLHVGTVNTIPLADDRQTPSDEETPFTAQTTQVPCAYVASKIASVQVVNDAVSKGLEAVIVHPGFMLGPYDWKPSSGRMMLELGKGWKPGYPVGGCSVCDVRDVALATTVALKQAPVGRHYVLAGTNMKYKQLWAEMTQRMGKPKPVFPLGPAIRVAAAVGGDLAARLTGHETDINSAGIKMSSQLHWHSSERARRELGYKNRPLSETLDDCAAWIKSHFL